MPLLAERARRTPDKGSRRPFIAFAERPKPGFDMSWKGFYGLGEDSVHLCPRRSTMPRRTATCSARCTAAARR